MSATGLNGGVRPCITKTLLVWVLYFPSGAAKESEGRRTVKKGVYLTWRE